MVLWLRICLPSAGDLGLTLGLGRSHVPWSNRSATTQLMCCNFTAAGPQQLLPALSSKKLLQRNTHTATCEQPLLATARESPKAQQEDLAQPQIHKHRNLTDVNVITENTRVYVTVLSSSVQHSRGMADGEVWSRVPIQFINSRCV